MQRELVLEADKSVIEGMVRAFGAILDEAKAQAKAAVEQPATAVHDYRRAVRRAESVALLASPLMRKAQRGWIRKAVMQARRRTRVLRDLDAVMPVIGKLAELDLGDPTALDALKAWLEEARGEVATEELVAWRLRKNVRSLAGLAEMFVVGVHAWADYDLLIESLRESYRGSRRAWAKADASKKLDDVHAWRRAARTLRYQLELLASRSDLTASAELKAAHATFKDQVKELGQVTDLFALRGIIEDAKEHVIGVEWKPLMKGLDAVIAQRLERVFEDAKVTFSVRPRDFVMQAESAAEGSDNARTAEAPEAPKVESDGGDEV
jgi:CHAD domain-containing protein